MRAIFLGGAALAGVLVNTTPSHRITNPQRFEATLIGASEVPPVVTQGEGKAEFTLTGDTVTYTINVKGMTGIVAAHIHIGPMVKTGPAAVTLYHGPKTDVKSGELTHGSFTAADIHGVTLQELINDMRKGDAYVNVHTAAHPAGEIRGQINGAPSMKTSS